jgi:hypothetical protein
MHWVAMFKKKKARSKRMVYAPSVLVQSSGGAGNQPNRLREL